MSVDTTRPPWILRAESALRSLRDVEAATIQADGDAIREIHVLTRSTRPPKAIVRDVQTVLVTRFDRSIDYRVVSVAYLDAASQSGHGRATSAAGSHPEAVSAPSPAPDATPPPPPISPAAEVEVAPMVPPASAAPQPAGTPGSRTRPAGGAERIRFGSVNLYVAGPRAQAQVELLWRGLPRMGSAAGWSTRHGAHLLVAGATLNAVQEFLSEEMPWGVQGVEFLKLGRRRVVVVSLSLLVGRQENTLVGACAVEQDVHQAVACATLAAMNRVVATLRPREPTEYVLRPTSV